MEKTKARKTNLIKVTGPLGFSIQVLLTWQIQQGPPQKDSPCNWVLIVSSSQADFFLGGTDLVCSSQNTQGDPTGATGAFIFLDHFLILSLFLSLCLELGSLSIT